MDRSMPGLPVSHQLPEPTQTHVHWVGDAIQPSHSLLSPSPPAFNLSQHQGLFQWVNSLNQVAKVLEFQLQRQSFQRRGVQGARNLEKVIPHSRKFEKHCLNHKLQFLPWRTRRITRKPGLRRVGADGTWRVRRKQPGKEQRKLSGQGTACAKALGWVRIRRSDIGRKSAELEQKEQGEMLRGGV